MFSKQAAEASSYFWITGKPEVASKDRLSTTLARSPVLGHDIRLEFSGIDCDLGAGMANAAQRTFRSADANIKQSA
jgi:hypothetical protein